MCGGGGGETRSQEAQLESHILGWPLPGSPDKSHCVVPSVLSHSGSAHSTLFSLDHRSWPPRQLIVALGQDSYRAWPSILLYGECYLLTSHLWISSPQPFTFLRVENGQGESFFFFFFVSIKAESCSGSDLPKVTGKQRQELGTGALWYPVLTAALLGWPRSSQQSQQCRNWMSWEPFQGGHGLSGCEFHPSL